MAAAARAPWDRLSPLAITHGARRMPIQNHHADGHDALDVAGHPVQALKAIRGVDPLADIAVQPRGAGSAPGRYVSKLRWAPAQATLGIGMGQGMYAWMKASFDKGGSVADGTLAVGDFNDQERSLVRLDDALLTPITVPRLDASSKESGGFDIEFLPGQVRVSKGDGSDIRSPGHPPATRAVRPPPLRARQAALRARGQHRRVHLDVRTQRLHRVAALVRADDHGAGHHRARQRPFPALLAPAVDRRQ